jgi:limonene-1,2-epoxide hydrolase
MRGELSPDVLPVVITDFLDAVNARNAGRVGACFTEDAAYHLLMPHPAVVGRGAIEATFTKIFGKCTAVRWETTTTAVNGDLVFLERVDRFFYDGRQASIECLGVFELDNGLITKVRDYADLGTWQQRKAAVQG